jgi:hypothetical protein
MITKIMQYGYIDMKQAHINTVSIPIERLIPHPKNYNVHPEKQIKKLRHLINTHGYSKGSVVYQLSTHYILAGHGIVEALKSEGYTHVDAIELDIDDSKAESFMIADNKVASDAIIDDIALQNLINELSDLNVPALDFGFDTDDLSALADRILADSGGYQASPQDDDIPEAVEPITKTGDLWILGKHRVLCGDSTIKENVERLLDGIKPDLCLTDPPYGINVDTTWLSSLHVQRGKPKNKSDDQLANDDGLLDLSVCYSIDKWFIFGFPYIYNADSTGWLIWDKHPGLTEEKPFTNPCEMAMTNIWKGFRVNRLLWAGYYKPKDEIRVAHPTQKPLGVIEPYLEGDIIFDPFLGSGSVLIASQKQDKNCVGLELMPLYVDVIVKRFIDFIGSDKDVFCERDGQRLRYKEVI